MRVYSLENPVQRYDWGSPDGLASALGVPNPEGGPVAELWMGAHPKAPSLALVEGRRVALDALVAAEPEAVLGPASVARFGPALPFLFKALSAGAPLSIQAHPAKRKAERGFERENLAGIPRDAPERNYRDANHKPEMAVALTRFEGLCGFRPVEEIVENIRLLSPDGHSRIAGRLERNPGRVELSVLFYSTISAPEEDKQAALARVRPRVERLLAEGGLGPAREKALRWAKRLFELFPGDIGALAPLLLNLVALEPGEAVFIGAGELHAYLEGTALEIMANSDNVIRGGLTRKHVDVPELISVLTFSPATPVVFGPERVSESEELYPAFAPDFQLSRLRPRRGSPLRRSPLGPEILLCGEGAFAIREGGGAVELSRGASAFVRADAEEYEIEGEGTLFAASVPRGGRPEEP